MVENVVRLYLSSFRLGRHPGRLVDLAAGGRQAAVIVNAMDASTPDIRQQALQREFTSLGELGFDCVEVDLRERPSAATLAGFDVLWVRGGNVFVLRRLLADTGLDDVLTSLLAEDRVVYAGYSAGACVLGTDLSELARVDDAGAVDQPVLTGLGLVDRPIVPHVHSPDHPESAACTAVSAELDRRSVAHWALRDGQVVLIDGNEMELLA
jgi:dipeptidase E